MKKIMVVCEFGSNPAPDWDFPVWCAAAKLAGADGVKVQLWKAEHFRKSAKLGLQYSNDIANKIVNWYEVIDDKEVETKRPLEFPRERFGEFVSIAHSMGLQAGASVFDSDASLLVSEYADFGKLAAREQDNHKLINAAFFDICQTKLKPLYRSISRPSKIYMNWHGIITLITMQEYPAPLIKSILVLLRWFKYTKLDRHYNKPVPWGFSSHTRSIWDCVFAVRLGASVIEKHFALDADDIEAGHSLCPFEFERMVKLCKL